MSQANSNLNAAKSAKNDEFYTRLEDVEAELVHYKPHFRGKSVYLNCDDPSSAFWQYFSERFDELGLRRLVATKYPEGLQFRQDQSVVEQINRLTGDGDFQSDECAELLKQADIVVTNPPFSLFREYVAQLVEHDKKFLIIGNLNAVTYRDIWPLIQGGEMWLGVTRLGVGQMYFRISDDHPVATGQIVKEGVRLQTVGNTSWFTNLDHARRHEELTLRKRYTPEEYPTYDNYDAINVNKVKEIPVDYDGVMGVPITFLGKWNPEQFEIVGNSENGAVPDTMKLPHSKARNGAYVDGNRVYKRIFIRKTRERNGERP